MRKQTPWLLTLFALFLHGCGADLPSVAQRHTGELSGEVTSESVPNPSTVPENLDEESSTSDDNSGTVLDTDPEDAPSSEDATPSDEGALCHQASARFEECNAPAIPCDELSPAACILDAELTPTLYCAFENGAEACLHGRPSSYALGHCEIRACLGENYEACIVQAQQACRPGLEGEASNASPEANEATAACEALEAFAGHCPNYGYDCSAHTESETICFHETLKMISDPCLIFEEGTMCSGRNVSEYGATSCQVQQCLSINQYDACFENLEILCSVSP